MTGRSEDPNSLRDAVFTKFFDDNWAALRHHIEGVVEDDDEVTEIVSAVFLDAWTRMDAARPMGRVWLLRAADRELRVRAGRSSSRASVLDAVHHGMSGAADAQHDGDAEREVLPDRDAVMRALAVLTARQRRIIMLAYWDGLTEGEISELIRYPRRGVRAMLRRARARMGEVLGLEGAGDHEG
ncbi:MAG: sigma-70 family RNA polymerase sigma factor [Candidatus Microbacterium colombiense]|nr:MAG: sigma-70 family RNA polymerase sigma factor [Microbacterium sp.]